MKNIEEKKNTSMVDVNWCLIRATKTTDKQKARVVRRTIVKRMMTATKAKQIFGYTSAIPCRL